MMRIGNRNRHQAKMEGGVVKPIETLQMAFLSFKQDCSSASGIFSDMLMIF